MRIRGAVPVSSSGNSIGGSVGRVEGVIYAVPEPREELS
jgi:hypothetical protein